MRPAIAIGVMAATAACLGKTPDDRARDAVVSVGSKGPTHNPGSACLLCHGFAMAGTVYRFAGDENGLPDVVVKMTDDAGHVFSATTNSTGNFLVRTGAGGDVAVPGFEGDVSIPWAIVYPVRVEISSNGVTKKMRNVIHQWGSCASCHTADKGASSNGRVYVEATP